MSITYEIPFMKKPTTATEETLRQCLDDVEVVTGVKPDEIMQRTRGYENVCIARFFIYTMLREHANMYSYIQIGKAMGRHHGAVISGITKLKDRLTYDKRVIAKAKLLRQKGYAV